MQTRASFPGVPGEELHKSNSWTPISLACKDRTFRYKEDFVWGLHDMGKSRVSSFLYPQTYVHMRVSF